MCMINACMHCGVGWLWLAAAGGLERNIIEKTMRSLHRNSTSMLEARHFSTLAHQQIKECAAASDVKLHLFQKGVQSFCETSANFMDLLRTCDIYWESQVDVTMASFIVG